MTSTFTIGAGTSDPIEVRRLGYGAMRLTGPGVWGNPADVEHARAVLRQVVEHDVNFIDTADSYGPATNEELIASTLRPYGERVIATKAGFTRQGPNRWTALGDPAYLEQCLEMSLRRLKVEAIDLWQLHRVDPRYPLADQLGVFVEAQKAGKVRHIGLSEVTEEQLAEAVEIAPIATVQNLYNLTNRRSEGVLQACEAAGIGFIPWYPVGEGQLAVGEALDAMSASTGYAKSQLALAWLLRRSPVVLPIPGTASLAHLSENCAAAAVELDDETWQALEGVSRVAGE